MPQSSLSILFWTDSMLPLQVGADVQFLPGGPVEHRGTPTMGRWVINLCFELWEVDLLGEDWAKCVPNHQLKVQ